jgi:predicted AAA+ superfamily ATPase
MEDFFSGSLAPRVVGEIQLQNPWWRGELLPPQPSYKRWLFDVLVRRLDYPLAKIIGIRGTRQVGKTTLQYQLIEKLLQDGVAPSRILRFQYDATPALRGLAKVDPINAITEWYRKSILKRDFNSAAANGKPAFIFLDEVQNLPDWDVQLKSFVDRSDVRVVITGSSALRIAAGRDSLAGRIQMLELGPLRLAEISEISGIGKLRVHDGHNGFGDWTRQDFWRSLAAEGQAQAVTRNAAFARFSDRGGYPLAHRQGVEWEEVAAQLNETVVKRVIEHDLRLGDRGKKRDEGLLTELFRLVARQCGQSPSIQTYVRDLEQTQQASIGQNRVRSYLTFLDDTLLIKLIEPLELALKRKRGPPKLCLSDHAVRAAWLAERVPLDPNTLSSDPAVGAVAGRIAESIVGYYFSSLGVQTQHRVMHKDKPEIDFILTVGDRRIPVEVKYQANIDPIRDVAALGSFIDAPVNRAPFGLLVTRNEYTGDLIRNDVYPISLRSLLMLR